MKINFLLHTIITVAVGTSISSCSTSYKTGQTPDDVYYSPLRLQTDEVRKEKKVRQDDNTVTVYDSPIYTTPEDIEIRRRIHNRRYRRYHDRYDNPYGYNGYPVYQNPKTGVTTNPSKPRKANLGAYAPNTTTHDSTAAYNPKLGKPANTTTGSTPIRTFSPSTNANTGTGVGNFIRKVFTPENSGSSYTPSNNSNSGSYNNSTSSPSRTFETRSSSNDTRTSTSNTGSSSTNSSSGSSTSAPVRTFKKDN